jgi:hypothetical protein
MRKIFATIVVTASIAVTFVQGVTIDKKRLARAQAAAKGVPSLTPSGYFEYQGCFKDAPTRVIPEYTGDVSSIDECRKQADAKGYGVFGLQYGGQCFIGKDDTDFAKLGKGPDSECGSPLGGTWTNIVFKKKVPEQWEYKGCFKDTTDRALPNYLGEVSNLDQCKQLATSKGHNVLGLQFFSQCWAGTFSSYSKFGAATGCPSMGNAWTNQIYVKPYSYKGCYKDNETRMVP